MDIGFPVRFLNKVNKPSTAGSFNDDIISPFKSVVVGVTTDAAEKNASTWKVTVIAEGILAILVQLVPSRDDGVFPVNELFT